MNKLLLRFFALLLFFSFFHGCDAPVEPLKEEQAGQRMATKPAQVEIIAEGMLEKADAGERFFVLFSDRAEPEIVAQAGGEVIRSYHIVPAVLATGPADVVSALAAHDKVIRIEPDSPVHAHGQTVPWGVDRVFGDETYSFETWNISSGKGIAVAILDTGIDENHEDLPGLLGGVKTVDDTHWGADGNGHGTHVAGTVAALDNDLGVVGVGPDVGLYAVKVLNDNGSGTVSSVVGGIEWAVDEGIPVLNMSLGSSSDSQTLREACDAAFEKGHLLVASAGNSGNPPGRGDNVGYPAAYESVIAVAASTVNDNRASYSSTGLAVELIAPGSNILSTVPGNDYDTKSGTSMAAPHVAGAAALAWAVNPELTNVQIREILQETAEDMGLSPNHQGYGLVRADLAVKAANETEEVVDASVSITPAELEGEAGPGEDAVYEFTVENTGDIEDSYALSVSSEWSSSISPESVTLYAGGITTVSVTHSVPEGASAGDADTGTIEAFSTETRASASVEFTTTAKGYAVEITPESQEGSGLAGETVEYVYTISNLGTEDDNYELATEAKWESTVSNTSVSVNAGESAVVTVSHTIPQDAEDGSSDTGTLFATSQADENVSDSALFTTTVQEEQDEAPVIDRFELTNTSNPAWARVRVDWTVSSDLGLDAVVTVMILNGNVVDSEISSVSGSESSGTHELRNRGGHNETYQITLTVTDIEGNSSSETKEISL